MRSRWAGIAIVVSAALIWWAPVPPEVVERRYSTGVYFDLQHLLTSASNRVPFALLDPVLAVVDALWVALAWRDIWRSRTAARAAGEIGLRTIVW